MSVSNPSHAQKALPTQVYPNMIFYRNNGYCFKQTVYLNTKQVVINRIHNNVTSDKSIILVR